MLKKTLIILCLTLSSTLLAAESVKLNATFQVPVPLDKIAHLATFEITDFQFSINANSTTLSYTLPEDLAGEKIIITQSLVSDTNGTKRFENEQGITECSGPLEKLECSVSFQNLALNKNKTITYLFTKYGYNQETKNRVMVSQIFAKELLGFIRSSGINNLRHEHFNF